MKRIYPLEALIYSDVIRERKNAEYLMELMIVSNPYSEKPNLLYKYLQRGLKETGFGDDKLDKEGLKRLKLKLKRKSKNIKVTE